MWDVISPESGIPVLINREPLRKQMIRASNHFNQAAKNCRALQKILVFAFTSLIKAQLKTGIFFLDFLSWSLSVILTHLTTTAYRYSAQLYFDSPYGC